MQTTTVRISVETHRALKEIAEQENAGLQDVIERAVEAYRKAAFFRSMAADASALTPKQLDSERAGAALWDVTLGDGQDR